MNTIELPTTTAPVLGAVDVRLAEEWSGRRRWPHEQVFVQPVPQLARNSLEVAAAVGTIMGGTVIIHLIVSWWPALAALI
jgi:hypothetical protein